MVPGGAWPPNSSRWRAGGKDTNRPQLHAALNECRKRRAVLVIARLDRLARNVAFIAALMGTAPTL
jgi:DNA invertase Pin-like site-specific DNA recombinase